MGEVNVRADVGQGIPSSSPKHCFCNLTSQKVTASSAPFQRCHVSHSIFDSLPRPIFSTLLSSTLTSLLTCYHCLHSVSQHPLLCTYTKTRSLSPAHSDTPITQNSDTGTQLAVAATVLNASNLEAETARHQVQDQPQQYKKKFRIENFVLAMMKHA